jgi:hypothetical protein
MATLVLTRAGFDDILQTLGRVPPQLWVNAGVLSELELANHRAAGYDITNFTAFVDLSSPSEVEHAIQVVREHHPLQRIWVEYPPGSPNRSVAATP